MEPVSRKVVYRMYPSCRQVAALSDMHGLHQRLYNAAIEQRVTAYRVQEKSVSLAEQYRNLTELRSEFPEYTGLNAQSAQVTLKRLDLAFQAFFRRVKAAETAGFPRFKSFERFSGWGYKTHGDGFRFTPGDGFNHGKLRLSGVGIIPVRGRARTPGEVATCEIQRKGARWYASFTIKCEPRRERGSQAVGLDWGVETFATLANEDESFCAVENPRFVREAKVKLQAAQQDLARRRKGSNNRKKVVRVVAAIHRKIASKRRDFLHKTSSRLVASTDLIATESLTVSNMTRSAKGTVQKPGRSVAQKAGLNREILSTAPSAFLAMLRYKAAEAGTALVEISSRKVKPSQTCSACGRQRKKLLVERRHTCECGCNLSRDENAARVNLLWALAHVGREPSGRLAPCA
jgi:putative transposase